MKTVRSLANRNNERVRNQMISEAQPQPQPQPTPQLPTEEYLRANSLKWRIGQERRVGHKLESFVKEDEAFRDVLLAGLKAGKAHPEGSTPEFERLCTSLRWDFNNFFRNEVPRLFATIDMRDWMRKYFPSRTNHKLLIYNQGGPENVYAYNTTKHEDDAKLQFDFTEVKYDTKESPAGTVESGDLHTMHLGKRFDIMVLPQTVEHLQHPILALQKLWEHLDPGGVIVVNQPYYNRYHADPVHFSQLSGDGFVALCELAGFEVLEYSEWGTLEYLNTNLVMEVWPRYEQILKGFDSEEGNYAQHSTLVRRPVKGDFMAPSNFNISALKVLSYDELNAISRKWQMNTYKMGSIAEDLRATLNDINGELLDLPMTQALAAYHLHKWLVKGDVPACQVMVLQPPMAVALTLPASESVIQSYKCVSGERKIMRVTHTLGAEQTVGEKQDLHLLTSKGQELQDIIIIEEALQFTLHPALVLQRVWNSLKDGGYVFLTHPFYDVPAKDAPFRMRFLTGFGVHSLLATQGFEVVNYMEWGNRKYIEQLLHERKRMTAKEMLDADATKSEVRKACHHYVLARKKL